MTKHRLVTPLAAVAAAATLAACGESAQDKAKSQVCDARSDISKQITSLEGMTISTATVDQISKSLKAIGGDLRQIADAQDNLSSSRRAEVKTANQEFATQVRSTVTDIGRSLSLSDANAQLKTAVQQLTSSYQQTYARIDC